MNKMTKKTKLFMGMGIIHLMFFTLSFLGCSVKNENVAVTNSNSSATYTTSNSEKKEELNATSTTIINADDDKKSQNIGDGCPKGGHCGFPGNCRLYTDSNSNNLCDLGESNA